MTQKTFYPFETAVVSQELRKSPGLTAQPGKVEALARLLVLGTQAAVGDAMALTLLSRVPPRSVADALEHVLGYSHPLNQPESSAGLLRGCILLGTAVGDDALLHVLHVLAGVIAKRDPSASYARAFREYVEHVAPADSSDPETA